MKEQIIISGFGGQGVLFVGKLLAYAGMVSGKQVAWIPSYGPEMRGGTANCSVTISDKEITSPIVNKCSVLLAFNEPSVDKFLDSIVDDGKILLNGSIIKKEKPNHLKSRWLSVPAQELAEELEAPKLMNMVMLGALLANSSILSLKEIKNGMQEMLGDKKPELIDINIRAIEKGMKFVSQEV